MAFLTAVNDYARATLEPDELCFEPLPSQADFIEALFADGNVCLTAGRDEKIDPACRSYLALFADGRLIVSDLYQTNRYGIYDYRKVSQFARTYPDYLYLQPQYVPQSYLDALYRRAEQYGGIFPRKKPRRRCRFNRCRRQRKALPVMLLLKKYSKVGAVSAWRRGNCR